MWLIGKMLVYASMLHCTDPLLTVAAALAHGRPIFLSPPNEEATQAQNEILCAARDTKSDHLAIVFAFNQYRRLRGQEGFQAARRWCLEVSLSAEAMDVIWTSRVEFAKSLSELGFVDAGVPDVCILICQSVCILPCAYAYGPKYRKQARFPMLAVAAFVQLGHQRQCTDCAVRCELRLIK
jgi:hypothetical protein